MPDQHFIIFGRLPGYNELQEPAGRGGDRGGKMMDATEIVNSYKYAKNKNAQIGILAELNACSKEQIINILAEQGAVPGLPAIKSSSPKPPRMTWTGELRRELVRLAEEGLTDEQIGERLGCSSKAVACEKARSKKRLKEFEQSLPSKENLGRENGPASRAQTAKADAGKPRLSLVPTQIIWDITEVREYGNTKYGDQDNWRGVEMERYIDALFRHFLAFLRDHDGRDKESGIEHYKHMACNMAFLCELMKEEKK